MKNKPRPLLINKFKFLTRISNDRISKPDTVYYLTTKGRGKYCILFWSLLILLTVAKVIYIGWGPLDLAPDEAHYWDWSRHLDVSYYSKGPFIAYTIFWGTKLGEITNFNPPNTAFWVRFPAVVYFLLMGIVTWCTAKKICGDYRMSWYVMLILTAIPIYAVGSILMTIDNPLMLFWAIFVYCVLLALETEKTKYWCLAGIALGLGFLTKYTMIVLIPCLLFYLAFTSRHRFWFRRKAFYLCLLIGCLFFIPVIWWNYKHGWIGFRHLEAQAGLAGSSIKRPFLSINSFGTLGEFIGTQLGVISPGLFIIIIWSFINAWQSYRKEKDYRYVFLFWIGVPLGIFYIILSLHKSCQANWPAPVYLTGAILSGLFFIDKKKINFLKTSIVIGLFMWLLVFSIDLLPKVGVSIPKRIDPTVRLTGWKKLGQEIGKIRNELKKEGPLFVFSDKYQITSELAFYIPGQPNTYCINLGRRMNQYDLWKGFGDLIGYNAIYVKHRDQEIDPEVSNMFKSWKKLPLINIWENTRLIHQYSVFLCYGYKGSPEEVKHEISY